MPECCICYEAEPKCILICGHKFCHMCIKKWYKASIQNTCPCCRRNIRLKSPDCENTKEIIVEYDKKYDIDIICNSIFKFHEKIKVLSKKCNVTINELSFLHKQPWTKFILPCEHNLNNDIRYTRYKFINNKDDTKIKEITIRHGLRT